MSTPNRIFRKAALSDIPAMMDIVHDAQKALRSQGVNQWQNGYPNEAQLEKDIAADGAYILLENEVVIATMALLPGPDPTYGWIDGAWLSDQPYFVIHRLAVRSDSKGSGVAAQMLSETESICKSAGISAIRVDTHHDNKPMQRFLSKNGFIPCGDIRLADGAPRIAFEKLLK